ncbi:hypothetical protein B566_EDAN018473 [Ephemera danica]|nr:hypothetical protein B566_EDAN018473 [Ephemera danica]
MEHSPVVPQCIVPLGQLTWSALLPSLFWETPKPSAARSNTVTAVCPAISKESTKVEAPPPTSIIGAAGAKANCLTYSKDTASCGQGSCARGCQNLKAKIMEQFGNSGNLAFISVVHRDKDLAFLGQTLAPGQLAFHKGFSEGGGYTHDFACRAHFRSKQNIHTREAVKRKDRFFYRYVPAFAVFTRVQLLQSFAHHNLGSQARVCAQRLVTPNSGAGAAGSTLRGTAAGAGDGACSVGRTSTDTGVASVAGAGAGVGVGVGVGVGAGAGAGVVAVAVALFASGVCLAGAVSGTAGITGPFSCGGFLSVPGLPEAAPLPKRIALPCQGPKETETPLPLGRLVSRAILPLPLVAGWATKLPAASPVWARVLIKVPIRRIKESFCIAWTSAGAYRVFALAIPSLLVAREAPVEPRAYTPRVLKVASQLPESLVMLWLCRGKAPTKSCPASCNTPGCMALKKISRLWPLATAASFSFGTSVGDTPRAIAAKPGAVLYKTLSCTRLAAPGADCMAWRVWACKRPAWAALPASTERWGKV